MISEELTILQTGTRYLRILLLSQRELAERLQHMERRVTEDGKSATKKEVAMIGGRLYYGFYVLPPKDKNTNRYLFYRNNILKPEAKPQEIMLVYIEGAASPDELKKIFK